jgi:hypothetical protein
MMMQRIIHDVTIKQNRTLAIPQSDVSEYLTHARDIWIVWLESSTVSTG